MQAFAGVKGKLAYEHLETARFIKAHNLSDFRMNPHFPMNSLLALRGLVGAQRLGLEAPYLEAVLAGFWEEGLKMDDPSQLRGVLDGAGLDGEALLQAAGDPAVKAALQAHTEAAVARGVFGIPTFFVGDAMFFGKERIGQVEAALVGGR
jgi:2-hydroxychromene-2-carboxylate isomerase